MRHPTPAARMAGLALVVALAAPGCALFGNDAAPAATGPSGPERATTSTTAPVEPGVIEVLDPGAAPRQELRVALREGDTATVTVTTDLAVDQTVDGRSQRLDSPPITQRLSYEVGAVTDAGSRVAIELEGLSVQAKGTGLDAREVAALEASLAPLVGLRAAGTLGPDGTLRDLRFRHPADLDPALLAQLEATESQLAALSAPLPPAALGVGARWRATATADVTGIEAVTTTTYEITSIDADTVGYRATITSTAGPQPVALAGLPSGTTARLERSALAGEATGTIFLTRPGLELAGRLAGPQQVVLDADGTRTDLEQQVTLAQSARTRAG